MPLVIAANVSVDGSVTEADEAAATFIVEGDNEKELALDPGYTPLPVTPLAALRTSYETVLSKKMTAAHADYADQARKKNRLRDEVRQAAKTVDDATWAQIETLLGV